MDLTCKEFWIRVLVRHPLISVRTMRDDVSVTRIFKKKLHSLLDRPSHYMPEWDRILSDRFLRWHDSWLRWFLRWLRRFLTWLRRFLTWSRRFLTWSRRFLTWENLGETAESDWQTNLHKTKLNTHKRYKPIHHQSTFWLPPSYLHPHDFHSAVFWLKCWRKMLTFWFWLTVSKKLTQNADVLWFLADRCQNEVADWHSKKQRSNRSLDLWKATDTLSVIIRSHHGEDTASHPNCEVKRHWAQAVLRLGTTRELWVSNVLPEAYSFWTLVSKCWRCWVDSTQKAT